MASQKQNYIVYVTVDGRDLGLWDTWTGGDNGSEDQRYKAAGQKEKSYGGRATRDPITVSRVFEPDRDGPNYDWLVSRRGKGVVSLRKQYVDDDEVPRSGPGSMVPREGKLIRVSDPESDSNDSSLSMYEIEVSPVA